MVLSDHPILYATYFIALSFLATTGTITFIEALRTNIEPMRHILNLETCISIVATYFYGKFIQILDNDTMQENMNTQEVILKHRYIDWAITTPIMLLVLILAFQYNSNNHGVRFIDYLLIVILNYSMLLAGYFGEIDAISKLGANITGFIFFGLLYAFMYFKYLVNTKGGYNNTNKALFLTFFIIWSFYGLFYHMDYETKNIGYNILDLISKCFVGIYFWSVSSNIFV